MSGKMLHRIIEQNNSILALDFSMDGTQFATAGKDFAIRLYDDDIKSVSHTFPAADWYLQVSIEGPERTQQPSLRVEVLARPAERVSFGRVGCELADLGHSRKALRGPNLRAFALWGRVGLLHEEPTNPDGVASDGPSALAVGLSNP